jgi:hypothetical protein
MLNPLLPDSQGATLQDVRDIFPCEAHPAVDAKWSAVQQERHLLYPALDSEKPDKMGSVAASHLKTVLDAPDGYFGRPYDYYIDQAVPNGQAIASLYDIQTLSGPPADPSNDADAWMVSMSQHRQRLKRGDGLGNAVNLSLEFLKRYAEDEVSVPNVNLDGDRGYGFPTWHPDTHCSKKPVEKPLDKIRLQPD